MSHYKKLYFLCIVVPAIVIALYGIMYVLQISANLKVEEKKSRINRIEALSASIQDLVNDNGKAEDAVRVALGAWRGDKDVPRPKGAFIWSPEKRLVWADDRVSDGEKKIISGFSKWNEWTSQGKKRSRRGLMLERGLVILWGRVDNVVYALLFDSDPTLGKEELFNTTIVISIILAFFVCMFSAGVYLFMKDVNKARQEALTQTTFLSNCSHELRTPLAGIRRWAELLNSGKLRTDEKRQHAYEVILKEDVRMIRLVENILTCCRLGKRTQKYYPTNIALYPFIHDMVDLVRDKFEKHGISISVDESCELFTDEDALKQIVLNLLANAAKYAAQEGPVGVEVKQSGENKISITVLDRGPGLKSDQLSKVFNQFYRVDNSLTAKTSGLGLGLAISRQLARDLSGDVTVENREGGGCAFTLELPDVRRISV